jgi:hypothetical protein
MAAVVWLKRGEQPPAGDGWALVDEDRSRGSTGMMDMVVHGSGATFYVTEPHGEAQRAAAIERAKAWVDNNGIATVYVALR